jgi:inhibitor of cysteine peptidase
VNVVTLTEANNGQPLELRQGDVVDLRLRENPTTGFRWQVVRTDGLVEEPAVDDAPPSRGPEEHPQVGAGGTRTFRFRARTPRTGRLELKLWREFEGDSSVVKRFAIDITIAD